MEREGRVMRVLCWLGLHSWYHRLGAAKVHRRGRGGQCLSYEIVRTCGECARDEVLTSGVHALVSKTVVGGQKAAA